jgi:hypothetical protein
MKRWRNVLGAVLAAALAQSLSAPAEAAPGVPNCIGANAWPSRMALTHLRNANLLVADEVDAGKTRVVRLASEKLGRDLYRQVHLVRFTKKSGDTVSAITVNEVSSEECSMTGVDVYPVTGRLGDYGKPL